MKLYNFDHIRKKMTGIAFWNPDGFWKWFLKTLLFLLLLLLFILVFTIPQCNRRRNRIGEDQIVVTPDGDTLVGKTPILFDPANPRPRTPGDNADGGLGSNPGGGPGAGRPVEWPEQIEDGRHPALPPDTDNNIPPTNPGDIITDPDSGVEIDGSHLLVVLDSDAGDETFNRFAEELSVLYSSSECSIDYYNTLTKLLILQTTPSLREAIKQELPQKITDIDFYVCDIEVITEGAARPSDPAFSYPMLSWHFEPVQAYEAWEITKGSRNVKVAVVDSYFDLDHYDLRGVNIIDPLSLENGTADVSPAAASDEGSFVHGTHVAGLIFAQMDNAEGSCGIAPGCSFIPVSLGTRMTTASLVEGILYAVYRGADVINASVGIAISDRIARRLTLPEQAVIAQTQDIAQEYLWDYIYKLCDERNVTIVWAAGNSNILSAIDNSKRGKHTVIVDALDQNLRKADFSNFGNLPDYGFQNSTVSAPGCSILSCIPYSDYYPLDGTSMAAPIVTGAVALMKSVCPTLKNTEVIEILKSTARPVEDASIGNILQIRSAIDKIREDFLRFDDVMQDHSLLLGRWESTELLYISVNGEPTGEKAAIIIEFSSERSGSLDIEFRVGERTGEICSTNLSVAFSTDRIIINEGNRPMSREGSVFQKASLTCRSDEQGLLNVKYVSEDSSEIEFYLRKLE